MPKSCYYKKIKDCWKKNTKENFFISSAIRCSCKRPIIIKNDEETQKIIKNRCSGPWWGTTCPF